MVSENLELNSGLQDAIKVPCAVGNQLADEQRFEEAIAKYNKAWRLVPEPKNDWIASTWILAAIADTCFLAGYKTSALKVVHWWSR
jgi:hypothetical protein